MQRKIGTEINLGKTVSPFDSISSSSAPFLLFKTVLNFLNAREKVQKIKKLIKTGEYDADTAKYLPRTLELIYQGMLEDIDRKVQLTA